VCQLSIRPYAVETNPDTVPALLEFYNSFVLTDLNQAQNIFDSITLQASLLSVMNTITVGPVPSRRRLLQLTTLSDADLAKMISIRVGIIETLELYILNPDALDDDFVAALTEIVVLLSEGYTQMGHTSQLRLLSVMTAMTNVISERTPAGTLLGLYEALNNLHVSAEYQFGANITRSSQSSQAHEAIKTLINQLGRKAVAGHVVSQDPTQLTATRFKTIARRVGGTTSGNTQTFGTEANYNVNGTIVRIPPLVLSSSTVFSPPVYLSESGATVREDAALDQSSTVWLKSGAEARFFDPPDGEALLAPIIDVEMWWKGYTTKAAISGLTNGIQYEVEISQVPEASLDPVLGTRTQIACVFFNLTNGWLVDGMKVVYQNGTRVVCESSHLTVFSVQASQGEVWRPIVANIPKPFFAGSTLA